MKKKLFAVGSALVLGAVILPAGTLAWAAGITDTKAEEIALKDAGFSASDITFVKAEQDWDDGRLIYDIEFITDDYEEYDYEIDAVSGDILSWDYDAEYYSPSKKPQNSKDYITLDEAKRAALKKAGLKSSEVTFLKAKQDFDDGSMKYELKFYSGSMEYEAEVDALTGKILDWEYEQAEGSCRRSRDHRADHHDDDWDDDYDDDHDFDDDYDD